MKRFFLLIFVLFTSMALGCTCDYRNNFLASAYFSETVVKARDLEFVYHTKLGERFTDPDKFYQSKIKNELNLPYDTGESMRIEIIELIKGKEGRDIIEIFNTDGANCRADIKNFEAGNTYLMALFQTKEDRYRLPNETSTDYAIGGCSENVVKYINETNEVYGRIKGRSLRRRLRKFNYEYIIKHFKSFN